MELDPLNIGLLALGFLVVAAFFAGVIDSVSGGGGLLTIPAFLLAGLPPTVSLGTNKLMSTVGTTASFITYARNGAVVWRVAAVGVAFSLFGSIAGAKVALWVDNEILGKVILVLLPLAAVMTFMPVRRGAEEKGIRPAALYLLTPAVCAGIGFYDGFFGPATGSFMLLSLHLILGLNLITASGTAKALNLASNASSLVVFLLNGNVYFFAAIPMAAANIAGNILGSRLALRQGPKLIRRMLLGSLALLFGTLVWRYYA